MSTIDPTDISGINSQARSWAAAGETIRPVAIEQLVIADDALDALVEIVASFAQGGRALMVADDTAMTRSGDELKPLVADRIGATLALDRRRLPDEHDMELDATREVAQQLAGELDDTAVIVSVGSGSVTDVAKYARHLVETERSRTLPFVCFPTAASVTAYTSALSVLKVDGVKRTLASRGPDAVVCDLKTLAGAPSIMTQAGFGDVLARSVAYGDWYLACELGMDDAMSLVPMKLLSTAEQAMIDAAESVARSETEGVRRVTEAVLLAGMAMSLVNQTAPISGWEHVISHYLDMTAKGDGRRLALHGGQVGVGTLVTARAYERAWPNIDLDALVRPIGPAERSEYQKQVDEVFGPRDPGGKMTAEIWRDFEKKIDRWQGAAAARERFVAKLQAAEIDEFLSANVRPACEVADALARAGAPQRFCDLDRPISDDAARMAVRYAHLVRARFTFGDLLDRAGWLTDRTAAELLAES